MSNELKNDDDLHLEFTGNFVYDAAVVGYELWKDEMKTEDKFNLVWALLGYKVTNFDKLLSLLVEKGLWVRKKKDNLYSVQLTKKNLFIELFYYQLIGGEENPDTFRYPEQVVDFVSRVSWIKEFWKEKNKMLEGKRHDLKKIEKHKKRISDIRKEYGKILDNIKFRFVEDYTKLPEGGETYFISPFPSINVHSKNSSFVFRYLDSGSFELDGVESPAIVTVASTGLSSSFNPLFPSSEEPYKFFSKEDRSFGASVELNGFKKIWMFYNNSFSNVLGKSMFIYHPDKEVCKYVNAQLRKIISYNKIRDNNMDENKHLSIIKRAVMRALVNYSKLTSMDTFYIIYEGKVNNQKLSWFVALSIKKHIANYFLKNYSKRFAEATCYTVYSNKEQKKDYLLFALNYKSPIEISMNYLRYLSDKIKDNKPAYGSNIFRILPDFQAYLERLGKARNLSPYKSFNYVYDVEYDRIYSNDLDTIAGIFVGSSQDKKSLMSYLISIARGNKKDKFISLATKLAFQQNKISALKTIEKVSRYNKVWIPVVVYIIFMLLKRGV